MSKPNNTPTDAGDASNFEDIFNSAGPSIGNGVSGDNPAPASPQAAASGDPSSPKGNQDPAPQAPQDGNQAAPNNQGQSQGTDSGEQVLDGEGNAVDPVQDPQRYQYWQSRHDQKAAELDKLKAQFEAQQPLLKYINENPEIAQKVYGVVQENLGQQPQQGSSNGVPSGEQKPLPQRPEKPTKPSDYNPVDAVSDEDSSSYKYRQQMEEYNEKLVEYNEQLVSRQQQEREQQQQQQQQAAQRNQQLKELYNEAVYRHGMPQQQAAQFVQWASNPDYGVEDLIAVFQARQQGQGRANQQAQNLQSRNQRLNTPAPPASQGNAASHQPEPEINEDSPQEMGELFTEDLMRRAAGGQ